MCSPYSDITPEPKYFHENFPPIWRSFFFTQLIVHRLVTLFLIIVGVQKTSLSFRDSITFFCSEIHAIYSMYVSSTQLPLRKNYRRIPQLANNSEFLPCVRGIKSSLTKTADINNVIPENDQIFMPLFSPVHGEITKSETTF